MDQKVDKLEDRLISIEKNLGRRNKIFDDSSDFIQRLEIMGSNVEFLFRAAGLGTQLNENTATKQIMDSLNRRAFEDRVRPVTPLDHLILGMLPSGVILRSTLQRRFTTARAIEEIVIKANLSCRNLSQ